jgi:hypothetical protein
MKLRKCIRRGTAVALMALVSSVGIAAVDATAASAGVKGTYTLTSLTLGKKHRFTTGDGGAGPYTYMKKVLTFTFEAPSCAVYTGTGKAAAGFSGTSTASCEGLTGTWSTGPVGTAVVGGAGLSSSGL